MTALDVFAGPLPCDGFNELEFFFFFFFGGGGSCCFLGGFRVLGLGCIEPRAVDLAYMVKISSSGTSSVAQLDRRRRTVALTKCLGFRV